MLQPQRSRPPATVLAARPRATCGCTAFPTFPSLSLSPAFFFFFSGHSLCVSCAVDHQFRGAFARLLSLAQERGRSAVAHCGLLDVGCSTCRFVKSLWDSS
ncbi:hypothetical protein PMIN03_003324 [Paraphaeosphaeria minitans]